MKNDATRVSLGSTFIKRLIFRAALGALVGLLAPSALWAQSLADGGGGRVIDRANKASAAARKPVLPEPDAIPGARAREPAAPATRSMTDMQPTDALFDAINRGDIAAARDSLNRGADLNGVNVLGMTPMELSVDLGRNDISFLLLSMRGEDSGRGSRAVSHDATGAAPASKTASVAPAARTPAKREARTGTRATAETPVASTPLATPKLFANDGGTPLPSSGFLGFGSRSAAN